MNQRKKYIHDHDLIKAKFPQSFSLKITVWIMVLLLGYLLIFSGGTLADIVGNLLVGLIFAHGIELQHQALHNTGFTSKKFNRLFGFILGIPMFVSFSLYKFNHLKHHAYLGTEKNTEFFNYGEQYGGGTSIIKNFIKRYFMLDHYVGFIKRFITSLFSLPQGENEPLKIAKNINREIKIIGTIFILLSILSVWLPLLIVKIWILPLLIATPIHALVELPEHYFCNTESRNVFENTRTIKSNAFMTWYTNGNNYHVEHHLYPCASIDLLPKIHNSIAHDILYYETSYFSFFKKLLGKKLHIKTENYGIK